MMTGNSADNQFQGRGGNDTMDGMGGVDTAVFSGLRSQSTLIPLDGNGVRVTGPDGADTLANVDKLTFNDQTVDWMSGFTSPAFELAAFGPGAGGWSSNDTYPRALADVNGDTRADIVGFSSAGVFESLATGAGTFAAPTFELAAFGVDAGGWSSDNIYPRELADVNGDTRADIVAFSSAGVYESLATGNGDFMAPTFELAAFGVNAGGWSSNDTYPRTLADVDGDGKADIIGFSSAGVYESLATAGGHFAMPTFELAAFGTMAGGWSSNDTYPRAVADVNGDGMADIVGFSSAGVYVSLATGNGHFGAATFELAAFGAGAGAGGWTSDDLYPRALADVNADRRADIVGFGSAGVYVSVATGGGHFAAPAFTDTAFGVGAGGWSSYNAYPRQLADVTQDGKADVVGFGYGGVHASQSEFIPI
jgi:FG-GAP-like repeat